MVHYTCCIILLVTLIACEQPELEPSVLTETTRDYQSKLPTVSGKLKVYGLGGVFFKTDQALAAAGLNTPESPLNAEGEDSYTIFAPSNAAWNRLGLTYDALLNDTNKSIITKLLKYHIVKGTYLTENLKSNQELEPLAEGFEKITISDDGLELYSNSIEPIKGTLTDNKNITAKNGVIHEIDRVLIPNSLFSEIDKLIPKSELFVNNITGLLPLGDKYEYEAWIRYIKTEDGSTESTTSDPFSVGRFTVSQNTSGASVFSTPSFLVDETILPSAVQFILSIEPVDNDQPGISEYRILHGLFSGGGKEATLSSQPFEGDLPIGLVDFSNATGQCVLGSYSDGNTDPQDNNYNNGLWFVIPPTTGSSTYTAGLNLPTLPAAYIYESWVLKDNIIFSMGKFSTASGFDLDKRFYTGTPPFEFPGEDFFNVPTADSSVAPLDLHDTTILVTIEPKDDLDPQTPFGLILMVGNVLKDTPKNTNISLETRALPKGIVTYTLPPNIDNVEEESETEN